MPYLEAFVFQIALKNITANVSPEVADVGVIINRRPAGVQINKFILNRLK